MSVAWEKALRRKLGRRGSWRRGWSAAKTLAFYLAFILFLTGWPGGWDLLAAAVKREGVRGVSTVLSFTGGSIGFVVGVAMANLMRVPDWQLRWTPGSLTELRRIQRQSGIFGWLVTGAVISMIVSTVTVARGGWMGPLPAAGLFAAGMAAGLLLGGGRWSVRLMFAGIVASLGSAWLQGFLASERTGFPERLVPKLAVAWPPGWIFQAVDGGGVLPVLLSCGLVGLGGYEWYRVWRPAAVPLHEEPAVSGEQPGEDAAEVPEPEVKGMRDLRISVAHGWIGLQGYVGLPAQWPDRWLWQWFTPRERLLACPGGGFASQWWKLARFAGIVPLVAVGAYWAWQRIEAQLTGQMFAGAMVAGFCSIALTIGLGWPGRNSVFRPWFTRWNVGPARPIPAYALFPVTVRELLRAAAKQWLVRCAPAGLVWFAGGLLGVYAWQGDFARVPAGKMFAATVVLCAVLLLVELQNVLTRSLDKQDRGVLAILSTLFLCGTVITGLMATVAVAAGTGPWMAFTTAMATLAGLAGFRFSLWRVEGRGRDLQ